MEKHFQITQSKNINEGFYIQAYIKNTKNKQKALKITV